MNGHRLWKVLYASVAGTSHEHRGEPCQDAAFASTEVVDGGEVLAVACADGAGTARRADVGARIACQAVVVAAMTEVRAGLPPHAAGVSRMRAWVEHARSRLSLKACLHNVLLQDYACTLLMAVVWERRMLLAQIGDGAIVYELGGNYAPAFWPQSGEYANQTYFLTDASFDRYLRAEAVEGEVTRLALFTDGLQRLALHEASRSVHPPFFNPLFARLADTADPADLVLPMQRWLSSGPVNGRTDDDKTLVLAVR